jgi:hypothetical protein
MEVAPTKQVRRELTQEQKSARKARYQKWADANRDTLNENVRAYRKRRYEKDGRWRDEGPKAVAMKSWMEALKSAPCLDCNTSFPTCCMDYDHRDATDKAHNIGSMFAHHYSRELIEIEIAKCDLVCSNCHRVRTRDRRIGSGNSQETN